MTWFKTLTGFDESSSEQVRANLVISGHALKSMVNGRTFVWGELETPSLAELRRRVKRIPDKVGRITVREVVANVSQLHPGTVYGFAIGDLDKDGVLDVGVARSDAPDVVYFGTSK